MVKTPSHGGVFLFFTHKKDFSAQNQQILNFAPMLRSESWGSLLTLPSLEEETTNKLS